jgi:hypothetical protein
MKNGNNLETVDVFLPVSQFDSEEENSVLKAKQLLDANFPDHSLIELWNLSIHHLRRRVEQYSIDLFLSTASAFMGGKKISYHADGLTLADRWCDIDDYLLISVACSISLISPKTQKVLDTINWMRNHASAAHESSLQVTNDDVLSFATLLKTNLFDVDMADPIHSPNKIMDELKSAPKTEEQINLIGSEIKSYPSKLQQSFLDFCIGIVISGDDPAYDNIKILLPKIWDISTVNKKTELGIKYQDLALTGEDNQARDRLFEMIVVLKCFQYIPDACRAIVYQKYAFDLRKAKDTTYGWNSEESVAKALEQIGPYVPDSVFEQVYQEILSVWCGNYWGRSSAYQHLGDFIFKLPAKNMVKVAMLFKTNTRVKSELYASNPKRQAIRLLNDIKDKLNIISQKNEIDTIIESINNS